MASLKTLFILLPRGRELVHDTCSNGFLGSVRASCWAYCRQEEVTLQITRGQHVLKASLPRLLEHA